MKMYVYFSRKTAPGLAHVGKMSNRTVRFLMISRLVGYIGVFSVNNLGTEFTVISHVEMFAVSTLNVVLHCVKLTALLPAQ